jgi:hypothetical protein
MFFPRSIAVAIDDIGRKTFGRDWQLYSTLLTHWRDIVGDDYARVTSPVKVSFPKGKAPGDTWANGRRTDGVLHIRLPQGLTMEFTFQSDRIRQRISTCFGYDAIARIVFEPYYGQPADKCQPDPIATDRNVSLPNEINDIQDDELRAALEGLGKVVIAQPLR